MIAFANVDLPDPLGPMIAWTSPWGTVRSIPFRISLPSTVACSPRTSRVAVRDTVCSAVCATSFVLHIDHDRLVVHRHGVDPDGCGGGQRPGAARVEVEGRPVL